MATATTGQTVWVTGINLLAEGDEPDGPCWGLVGVFTSEQAAVTACENACFFVARMRLDGIAREDIGAPWEDMYYPMDAVNMMEGGALQ